MSAARRVLLALAAPLIAVVAAMVITSLVVLASQSSPAEFWTIIFEPPAPRVYVNIVNQSAMIFLSDCSIKASRSILSHLSNEARKRATVDLPTPIKPVRTIRCSLSITFLYSKAFEKIRETKRPPIPRR